MAACGNKSQVTATLKRDGLPFCGAHFGAEPTNHEREKAY